MTPPREPSPTTRPDPPLEVAQKEIDATKDLIMYYSGECEPGLQGRPPGRWHKQPVYCHVLCESDTTQRDLYKFQADA